MNIENYGLIPIDKNQLNNKEKELFKGFENHIYKNIHPDPIIQMLRPYIYIEHPAIIFEVPLFPNYIEGRLRQFKNHSVYDRLTFLVDTWAIDIAMEDAFSELSEKEQVDCYIKNRKRKEYDFEEYDKLYKPKKKKQVKLPDNIKNKKEITIYRGIAPKSNKSLKGVLSWTTDLNTAKFFKNRFGNDGERYILIGKCNPKDIEEYYDNEFEVLIDCRYIKDIHKLNENTMIIKKEEKMGFNYQYARPALTVDMVIFNNARDQVLMIQRGNEPFKGCLALPGGFVDENELVEHAVLRELKEETNVANLKDKPKLVGVFSKPGRDPRGWTVSIAYKVIVNKSDIKPKAGDDAAKCGWVNIRDLNKKYKVAFDHIEIIQRALK